MPFLQRPNGCRLFYEVFGAGDPLVLLEGMGGDVTGWRRSIPTLAGELRVVAGDFRGNGRSDGPDEPMTIGTLADDTLALLDHLHIDAAHLYGQSLGGMVAQGPATPITPSGRRRRTRRSSSSCGRCGPSGEGAARWSVPPRPPAAARR
ncbi:MAG TPA: alpha/beta fold hydrolase [Actinomycetota bacterium]|nr:alpha/beta fold hydrolase [Actinomycetota bacterium]